MSQLILNERAVPSTPSSGKAVLYVDQTATPLLRMIDDSGLNKSLAGLSNYSVVAQTPAAATRTYIAGSALAVPKNKLQVGSCFEWSFNMTKTAAGTAPSTFDICVGTNGSTSDTSRVAFTKPAGTADADEALVTVRAVVRTIGATGVMVGIFTLMHNLENTGHAVIPCVAVKTVSAGFDMTVADLIVGLCITSGAADAITIEMVQAKAWNI